jgi:glutathione S-transferase
MSLKVYGLPLSRAWRTLWMVEELGCPYELKRVEFGPEGTESDWFRKINPNGAMPVIDDNGLKIFESLAINLYLAKRFGGPLAGKDASEEAQLTMWTIWGAEEVEPAAVQVMSHTIYLDPAERKAKLRDEGVEKLQKPFKVLSEVLAKGKGHIVGGRTTVADINLMGILYQLRGHTEAIAKFPKVDAWYKSMTARPAFKKVMAMREADQKT